MEKRKHKRYAKRFRVRYGEAATLDKSGFTSDVSATGLFVMTNHAPKPGARMHLELSLDGGRLLYLEAVVARVAIVAPELRGVLKGGFGVRYLLGTELLGEMVPHLKDKVRLTLSYGNKDAFKTAFENELKRGGAFVWTTAPQKNETLLTLEVEAEYSNKVVTVDVKVVHSVAGADGRWGLGLMFVDAKAALESLAELLG